MIILACKKNSLIGDTEKFQEIREPEISATCKGVEALLKLYCVRSLEAHLNEFAIRQLVETKPFTDFAERLFA